MADEKLKITSLRTGDELYYMSEKGVLHCIVVHKSNMQVLVQNIDRPRKKLWLSARQIEFECTTKQEMDTPCEPMVDEKDKQELQDFKLPEFKGPFEEDDPADWWKKGKKD